MRKDEKGAEGIEVSKLSPPLGSSRLRDSVCVCVGRGGGEQKSNLC